MVPSWISPASRESLGLGQRQRPSQTKSGVLGLGFRFSSVEGVEVNSLQSCKLRVCEFARMQVAGMRVRSSASAYGQEANAGLTRDYQGPRLLEGTTVPRLGTIDFGRMTSPRCCA